MKPNECVILDIITNGIHADIASGLIKGIDPIEIYAIKTDEKGKVVDEFYSLVQLGWGNTLPDVVTSFTGLSYDLLKDAPDQKEVLEKLVAFIGDLPVVGFGVTFDVNVLNNKIKFLNTYKSTNLPLIKEAYCLRESFKAVKKEDEDTKLKTATDHYGLSYSVSMNAKKNAVAAKDLLIKMLEESVPLAHYVKEEDGGLKRTDKPVKERKKKEKEESTTSSYKSYFEDHISFEKIAEEKNVKLQTVESNFIKCLETGHLDGYEDWLNENAVEKEDIPMILQLAESGKLLPIKEHFGDKYSYTQIKLCIALNKKAS